jgi:predicted nucleotidyltransferase
VFGSGARGTATQDSDVDVFVECGERLSNVRFLDRLGIAIDAKEAARNKGFTFSSDIIVWTKKELATGISSNTPFWQTICKEGVLIYERRRTS